MNVFAASRQQFDELTIGLSDSVSNRPESIFRSTTLKPGRKSWMF